MEQLLEDYQRRVVLLEKLISEEPTKTKRYYRLKIKLGCYRSFVTDLKREMLDEIERRDGA